MRLIDRWVGIPLCFFAIFWTLKKAQADSNSTLVTNIPLPDTIFFILIAKNGALVVAYPAIKETLKKHPKSRIYFITAPAEFQPLVLMGFEKEDIILLETTSIKSLLNGIVNIRSHFNGKRVSAIVLESFTRFSTLLSAWIGGSKRIGCYRFMNEGV